MLSCSNTCCWVNMHGSTEWTHIQYFLILDILIAYDLSSDIFQNKRTQLASPFYGGLLHHLTSCSLWVSSDQKLVTTVCPNDGGGLFAWGDYKSKKPNNRNTQSEF